MPTDVAGKGVWTYDFILFCFISAFDLNISWQNVWSYDNPRSLLAYFWDYI